MKAQKHGPLCQDSDLHGVLSGRGGALHNMGNWSVKMRGLEIPVTTAPEDPLAHPYLRGTSVSRHTFTEELARKAAMSMDMSRK